MSKKENEQDKQSAAAQAEAKAEEAPKPKKVSVVIKSLPYNGRYGFRYRENSVQSVDADEAEQLVQAGIADYVEQAAPKHTERHQQAITADDLAQKQEEARTGADQTGAPIEDPFSHKQEGVTGGE